MTVIRASEGHIGLAPIRVEFAVLHYTVEDLSNALRMLSDASGSVSAHLVIAPDGDVHELVTCWDGVAYRAKHAGHSSWHSHDEDWEGFNEFSIGIELVNRNGNVFDFTDAQYEAIGACLRHLLALYPALASPERIVGHEHIAGWRGKVDPGSKFDWPRLYSEVYPGLSHPKRSPTCPPELLAAMAEFKATEPSEPQLANSYWRAVSRFTETAIALLNAAR